MRRRAARGSRNVDSSEAAVHHPEHWIGSAFQGAGDLPVRACLVCHRSNGRRRARVHHSQWRIQRKVTYARTFSRGAANIARRKRLQLGCAHELAVHLRIARAFFEGRLHQTLCTAASRRLNAAPESHRPRRSKRLPEKRSAIHTERESRRFSCEVSEERNSTGSRRTGFRRAITALKFCPARGAISAQENWTL
jgi:hypothetical protein